MYLSEGATHSPLFRLAQNGLEKMNVPRDLLNRPLDKKRGPANAQHASAQKAAVNPLGC